MDKWVGVAISTTGHERRIGFLETAVQAWLSLGVGPIVTVDGSAEDADRVYRALPTAVPIYRVGQPKYPTYQYHADQLRLGVAVSKNTGIELLMNRGFESLFLADDDIWPLNNSALGLHTYSGEPHSMVMWGKSRFMGVRGACAEWNWPRGVLLYALRSVIDRVGGMDERFGRGGNEHAEWSRRIHQAGLTTAPFISPEEYALDRCRGASEFWHVEDMPRLGEAPGSFMSRKRRHSVLNEEKRDWKTINEVMEERDGDTSFVPYAAGANGRLSATLYDSF